MLSRRRNIDLPHGTTPASSEMEGKPQAPVYNIERREVIAVEHPMIIKNLDDALKTFGTNRPFRRILDSDDPEECLPLYLRPNDPMCVPVLSHNGPTNNILLQITVPKRMGRKRKRGSQDSYNNIDEPMVLADGQSAQDSPPKNIRSQSRMDSPAELMRTLKDNVGKYTVKAVAQVNQTHRFRGLSDFQQSTANGNFMAKMQDTILTGEVAKMRDFKFDPRIGYQTNEEILPPPSFTSHSLPFNWAWHQNPNIFTEVDEATGEKFLVNRSRPAEVNAKYLSHDVKSLPIGPPSALPDEPGLRSLINDLQEAFRERPVWTRRALMNRIGHSPFFYLLRHGLQYVGYQFKGGPFRDAIIKYGVDPRTDKSCRIYQTLFFKIYEDEEKKPGMPWHDVRPCYTLPKKTTTNPALQTHHFDGKNLTLDGKIWQMCDITDPLLARLIESAPYRETFDTISDGWFTNGALAKIKAIMKVKLVAIRTSKEVPDEDFKTALEMPDIIPGDKRCRNIHIPVPDIRLTEDEIQILKEKGVKNAIRSSGLRKRVLKEHQRRARLNNGLGPTTKDHQKRKRHTKARVQMLPSEIWGKDGENHETGASSQMVATVDSIVDEDGIGSSQGVMDRELESAENEDESDNEGEGDESGDVEDDSSTVNGEEEEGGDSDGTDEVDYQRLYEPDGVSAIAE